MRARLSPVGEGLQVLVYAHDQPGLFARITGFFERMQFDVAAAKIYTTQHGYALDTFQVLPRTRGAGEHYRAAHPEDRGQPRRAHRRGRAARFRRAGPRLALGEALPGGAAGHDRARPPPGPLDGDVELRRPARACSRRSPAIFLKHGLNLIDARVNTLGARAEDAFVVNGAALEDAGSRDAIAADLRKTAVA